MSENKHNELRMRMGLYSQSDIRRICGIDQGLWRQHLDAKLIQPPTTPMPCYNDSKHPPRMYYTKAEMKALKKHFKQMPPSGKDRGLISKSKMADALGTSYTNLRGMIRTGRLPAPSVESGCRWYYRPEDVEPMRKMWQSMEPKHGNSVVDRIARDGFFTVVAAAAALGAPLCTMQKWQKEEVLPMPKYRLPYSISPVYTPGDIENMRWILKERNYVRRHMVRRKGKK